MTRINSIPYAPENGFRGLGDLFLPENPAGAPAALVIHGGALISMDKTSIEPIARLMVENGYAAFNINYRLLTDKPWPACGDDCIAGANFLLNAGHPAMEQLDRSRIVIIGASAGAFLTQWTAFHLPQQKVRAIISIAGNTDLVWGYQRRTEEDKNKPILGVKNPSIEMLRESSPITYVYPGGAPLLCIHSINDKLVLCEQSEILVNRYREVGSRAELVKFPGKGHFHGIWEDQGGEINLSDRILVPEVTNGIRDFLKSI
jgi:dipeptidyl aminopeptidase/acylaminoacyl peptidase